MYSFFILDNIFFSLKNKITKHDPQNRAKSNPKSIETETITLNTTSTEIHFRQFDPTQIAGGFEEIMTRLVLILHGQFVKNRPIYPMSSTHYVMFLTLICK